MEITSSMGKRKPLGFTMETYQVLNKVDDGMKYGNLTTGAYILQGRVLAAAAGHGMPVYEADDSICTIDEPVTVDEILEVLEEATIYDESDKAVVGIGLDGASIIEALDLAESDAEQQVLNEPVVSEDIAIVEHVATPSVPAPVKADLTFIKVVTK